MTIEDSTSQRMHVVFRNCPRPAGPAAALWLLLAAVCPCAAQGFSASAEISSRDVFLGEAASLNIVISGADDPEEPDLSALTDFSVAKIGARQNNMTSTTIINGRVSRNVSLGYVFSYQLVPRRAGTLRIPAIRVTARGKTAMTNPLEMRVSRPEETEDFKLRMKLSRDRAYVGEPVTLTVTWYLGKQIGRTMAINVPALQSGDFATDNPALATDPKNIMTVGTSGGEMLAVQGAEDLAGRGYTTVTFYKVLIPKRPGKIAIEPATVVFEAFAGRRQATNPFDEMFGDGFFGGARNLFKKVVIASPDALELEALPLPEEGRPANFAGHVGRYAIETGARPLEVSVGDPITLTVAISGPDSLENVELPPLRQQAALARDFKIPAEMSAGVVGGKRKVFTQTIRAMRSDVERIPPIELSYFDTSEGAYKIARSRPIPLKVKETRIVNANDAEGREFSPAASALEGWGKGLAHNYEDGSVLEDRALGMDAVLRSRAWLAVLLVPPGLYFLALCAVTIARGRGMDPLSRRARRAYGEFLKRSRAAGGGAAGGIDCGALLDATREYLAARLKMPGGALTYEDVAGALSGRGVDGDTLAGLRDLFHRCEAASYAGDSAAAAGDAEFLRGAGRTIRNIERKLK